MLPHSSLSLLTYTGLIAHLLQQGRSIAFKACSCLVVNRSTPSFSSFRTLLPFPPLRFCHSNFSSARFRPRASRNMTTERIPVRERRPSVGAPIVNIQGSVGPAGITRPKHKRTFTGFGAGEIKSVEGMCEASFVQLGPRCRDISGGLGVGFLVLFPSSRIMAGFHSVLIRSRSLPDLCLMHPPINTPS